MTMTHKMTNIANTTKDDMVIIIIVVEDSLTSQEGITLKVEIPIIIDHVEIKAMVTSILNLSEVIIRGDLPRFMERQIISQTNIQYRPAFLPE